MSLPRKLSLLLGIASLMCFVGAWVSADGPPHRWIYLAGGFTAFGISSAIIGLADVLAEKMRRNKESGQ